MRRIAPVALIAVMASAPVAALTAADEIKVAPSGNGSGEPVRHFTLLPCCVSASGGAEVLKPGADAWIAADEGKYYPLGSRYRTGKGGTLTLLFGPANRVSISGESAFSTKAVPLGAMTRTIVPHYGVIEVSLAKNLPEGLFSVSTPSFVVKNPAGGSRYSFNPMGDGYEVTVRCITGSIEVEGRHFTIPSMQAADEFRLRSNNSELETIIYGTSGDYVVKVDRGIVTSTVVTEEGGTEDVSKPSFLDWRLSVDTKIRINRAVPSIGERMSVSVMAFDAAGNMKNHYAFSEGRAEVNSGELVMATKEESEKLAKRAADVAEETVTEQVVAPPADSATAETQDGLQSNEE